MKNLLIILALLAVPAAFGGTTNSLRTLSTNAAPIMKTELKAELIQGGEPFYRAYITTVTTRFAFLVPQAYLLRATDGNYLKAAHRSNNSLITVKFRETADGSTPESFMQACHADIVQEFPKAAIVAEYADELGGQARPLFDLNNYLPGFEPQQVRVVFIKVHGGRLEFELTSNKEHFKAAQYDLNAIMLTFREADEKTGKLTVVPLTGKY